MRYIDTNHSRLIFIQETATPEFWDKHWNIDSSIRTTLMTVQRTWVSDITKKFLKPETGLILEGGCGTAIHFAAMVNNGYRCIGVDYAIETVNTVNNAVPHLDVRQGDVRHLQFKDGYFAGYWSLGVIEHFWDGYEPIGLEMARVIKPGGFLFLTFPYLSPLRKLKAKMNIYPNWESDLAPAGFYQFALDHQFVVRDFENWGFERVNRGKPMLGLRATKEELGPLNPVLEWLYRYKGPSVLPRGLAYFASLIFTPISGHMILLVFRKK